MSDIKVLRQERLGEIIGVAHGKLQQILVDSGLDPSIARMIAATRLYNLLPPTVRQQIATVESDVATRLVTLFRDVAKADEEGLKSIPFE